MDFQGTLSLASSFLLTFTNPTFLSSLLYTLSYLLIGILTPLPLAFALGTLAGTKKRVDDIILPVGMIVSCAPGFIFGPLLLWLLGPSALAVILTSAFASFFTEFELIRSGIREIPKRLFDIVGSFNASTWQAMRHVVFPPIVPRILESFRICISGIWDSVLAAEVLANVAGLGSFIFATTKTADTNTTIAGIVGIIAMTVLIDRLVFHRIEERVGRWK